MQTVANYTHCGNYRNLVSHFFGKNFVKAILLKKLLKSWFDEIFRGDQIFHFSTLLCSQCGNYGNLLSQIFDNNFVKLTILVTKELIWRKKISVRENFAVFDTLWKLRNFTATVFPQLFRQIKVLLKNFAVNWFDEKSFPWQWISRFSTLCKITEFYCRHGFFSQNIRQINLKTNKELYYKLIWWKNSVFS